MIKQIDTEYKAVQQAKAALAKANKELSDALELVKAEKGTSFAQGANFYQIRKRGDLNYICKRERSKGNFGSWLEGKGRKQMAAKSAPTAPEATAEQVAA